MKNEITNNKPVYFIGLGGTGSILAEYIHNKGIEGKYIIVTEQKKQSLAPEIDFIEFAPKGYYVGRENEKIKISDYTQELIIPEKLKDLFNEEYHFVLLAGFGGFSGTSLSKELFINLINSNKSFSLFCSLPFDFEGNNRKLYANSVTQILQGFSNFHSFDLNMIRQKYGNLFLDEAFEKANEEIYLSVKQLIINNTKQQ